MALFKHKHKSKKEGNKPLPGHSIATLIDNSSSYNDDPSLGPPLPIDKWVDKPLLLCINPCSSKYTKTNYQKQIAIPINTVFEFESKLFKGKAIVRSVEMPNTDKSYFKGRARKMDFTFQGKFKRKICFNRLYTGQIFDKPFTNIPGQFIVSAGIKLVKSLAPALRADINSDTPYMMSPLASAAQVFQISLPGKEIKLPNEPKEDIGILGKKFKKMQFTERKKYFHNLDNLKHFYFETDYVYTISCYTHMISPSSYNVLALGMKWPIYHYAPSPMQIATVVIPQSMLSINEHNDDSSTSSSSATSNESTLSMKSSANEQPNESMLSEELLCESKEDEEEIVFDDSGENLTKCEFLSNFQIWHEKLVEELFKKKHKTKEKNGGGFRLFGR